jgi:hypothetical protein
LKITTRSYEKRNKKEIDDLILSGQNLSPEIYRKNVKLYWEEKSEEEEEKISEYLSEVHISLLKQAIDVTNNLIFLKQLEGIEEFLKFINMKSACKNFTQEFESKINGVNILRVPYDI